MPKRKSKTSREKTSKPTKDNFIQRKLLDFVPGISFGYRFKRAKSTYTTPGPGMYQSSTFITKKRKTPLKIFGGAPRFQT